MKEVLDLTKRQIIDTSHIKKRYCMILLFNNKNTKEMAEEQSKKVQEIIVQLKGTLDTTEYCGEKELAYKIKGCSHAHYIAIYYFMPHSKNLGASLKELIRKISNMQSIIRYMNLSIKETGYAITSLKNFKK